MGRPALEILAWSCAVTLLAVYAAARVTSEYERDAALRSFDHARGMVAAVNYSSEAQPIGDDGEADTSLWSSTRIAAYRRASATLVVTPLAVLRIPELGLRVPIFPGTGASALDRGAGHIEGTPMPGSSGNVGLAAHRDGFFRVLKDARVGQTIYLDFLHGTLEYRISTLRVVEPADVSVLADHGTAHLTLVTCYPFYFVGPAPKRFIVRAERTDSISDTEGAALARAQHR